MIDGMEMDAGERMRAPSLTELERYSALRRGRGRAVVGARVGARGEAATRARCSRRGAAAHQHPARSGRGHARGRLYLPQELLAQQGIATRDPDRVLADPALPKVCDALADRARQRFEDADRLFAGTDRHRMRPALVMMRVYRRTLERLVARGWQRLDDLCAWPSPSACGSPCGTACSDRNGAGPRGRGGARGPRRGDPAARAAPAGGALRSAQQAGGRCRSYLDRGLGRVISTMAIICC